MNAPFRWFARLSWSLKAAWIGLLTMFVLLFAVSARYQIKKPPDSGGVSDDSLLRHVAQLRRESSQEHEEIRRQIDRLSQVRIGTIHIPRPDPALRIGGVIVTLDMTGAQSLDDPRVNDAAKLFDSTTTLTRS